MLDSRHLATFHEVVGAGSYSAAARTLGCTQPAITQQMKALERSVGMPLFVRVGRRLGLTEAGEALARHTGVILDHLSAAEQQLHSLARLRGGRVRICAFPSANATLVPEAIARLLADHPGIRVELQEEEPPASLRRLPEGSCDIALAFSYPGFQVGASADLMEYPLMEDLLTVLLPVGHPAARRQTVRLPDLAAERWIAGCPRCQANLLHACAEQGFTPDIVFATDDNLAIQNLVSVGAGIALMPALVLAFLRHDKVTARAVEPHARRRIAAYVLREHAQVPAIAQVLKVLQEAASAHDGC
ncbi:LysR family transcriptional regulator [Streptacidiphilus sp. EB129]|uniref:LysR family transcriptional regulator n=1 Tax=Streptacidiphilus sp. EB129 TaxID=3156262 RepID=UPI0035172603